MSKLRFTLTRPTRSSMMRVPSVGQEKVWRPLTLTFYAGRDSWSQPLTLDEAIKLGLELIHHGMQGKTFLADQKAMEKGEDP